MTRYVLLAIAFSIAGAAFAQLRPDQWTVYKKSPDQLRSETVTAIAIDSTGRLWCTPLKKGVMGVKDSDWVALDPPGGTRDSYSPALTVTRGNALWMAFGSEEGVTVWNGTSLRTMKKKDGMLPSDNVLAISSDAAGTMYIATDKGLCVLDTSGHSQVIGEDQGLPSKIVAMVGCAPSKRVWLGFGKRTGVAMWDGKSFTTFDEHNSHFPESHAFAITVDTAGTAWVGTDGGGLAKCDGTDVTLYTVSNSALPDNTVNAVAIDPAGGVWIGTLGGLAHFDGTNWQIRTMSTTQLPNDRINALAVDRAGALWIATDDGLAKLVPGEVDK